MPYTLLRAFLCFLLLISPAYAGRTAVATDDFNRASLGSDWAQLLGFSVGGDVVIVSSTHVAGNSNQSNTTDACVARWVGAGTYSNDQYAKIKLNSGIGNNGSNYRIGVVVRASADTEAGRDFYGVEVEMDGTGDPASRTVRIFKTVNGTKTSLTTGSVSIGTADTIELEVEGSNLRAYKSGVQILTTQTDTALTTGSPGMLFSGGTSDPTGDLWEGGDVTASAGADTSFFRRRSIQ